MDIGNISSMYSDMYAKSSDHTASKLQGKLEGDYSKASNEELMDVCKEFEAYFLEQMFKEMMKTIPSSEESSGSTENMMSYYKEEMVKNLASDSTEQNSLGLAQMLYDQMCRNYGLDIENV